MWHVPMVLSHGMETERKVLSFDPVVPFPKVVCEHALGGLPF